MYHYVNNLQTRAGDALADYYVKLKDSDGNYATLYSDTSLTPISTASGVADAAKTNDRGMFDLYVEDGIYDVEAYDSSDLSALAITIASVPLFGNVFQADATGAVERTVQDKIGETISLKDFGAVGDGTTDDTAAVAAAMLAGDGLMIYVPPGTYLVDSLTIPADTFIYGNGACSIIKKRSSGDLVPDMGMRSTIQSVTFDFDGASLTGRGVLVTTGDLDNVSWRKFIDVHFLNGATNCLEFTAAKAGYSTQIEGCRFTLAGATRYTNFCVQLPTGETNNGNRFMTGCWFFGYRMFDAGECDNLLVSNCQGAAPKFRPLSKKVLMSNCRIVTVGDASLTNWEIDGNFTKIVGCCIGEGLNLEFKSTCANVKFVANSYVGTITDSATGMTDGNEFFYKPQTAFAPTWTASSGSPAIGAGGTLSTSYSRRGGFCFFEMSFIYGAAGASTGTGAWTFTLPFACNRHTVGRVHFVNAAGSTVFVGNAYVASGAQTFQMVSNEASNAFIGAARPWAWATGDKMFITLEYPIQ